jgi:hypothetical protein
MWQILNQTPYQADRAFARDRDGAEHWIVAVRATFRFDTAGNVELAPEQQPVKLAPEFFGEPGKTSLRYDTDVALGKRRTDVIVNGSAYAPGGRPARQVDVSVSVGSIVKRLRVVGDRFWVKSLVGRIASDPRRAGLGRTKKLDFLYKHVVGRPVSPNEPDFGPGFVPPSPAPLAEPPS